MKKLGLHLIKIDENIFINIKKDIIIALYINNILIINRNKSTIRRIKNDLNVKFHIFNLRSYVYYLDIIIKRNRYIDIIRLD